MPEKLYTMQEVCKLKGFTYETLKFYCRKGLVPNVRRDSHNYRVFDEQDLRWIDVVKCLLACDMSIKEIQEYISLVYEGEQTIPRRAEIMTNKRREVEQKIAELNESLEFIKYKEQLYRDIQSGKIKYQSTLTK